MRDDFEDQALRYHQFPSAGKIEVTPTKPLANQRDLALAYSPGVAVACNAIVDDPQMASSVTARGNLVAVITNGTAVLGLGPIGPLAAKPVMEGKGVLFKKFAGIDVFDLEVDETDPDKFVDIVASLEPTFGGINLEDIKAPECFEIERKLRERMHIPVFHDDQHGTAIIAAAAILNGLRVVEKNMEEVRLVTNGAGAAGMACLDLLVRLGMKKDNIIVCDSRGVIYQGRNEGMDARKTAYATDTERRTLADAVEGADLFLGVSGPGLLTQDMVKSMAENPIILALANPTPEIMPEAAKEVRPDAIIATGRSDYPNQVNNVLCFPYIFRGALDVGATTINEEMKLAVVKALADMVMAPPEDKVVAAYGGQTLSFGPDYLIPKPFDPQLILQLPKAVAKAAMETGVATRPLENLDDYDQQLRKYVFRSSMAMRPVFARAQSDLKRVIFAEGEEERILRAVQVVIDDRIAIPIVVGRRQRVERNIERLGLHINIDRDFQLIDPFDNPYYEECWREYHRLRERHGVDPSIARIRVNTRTTVLSSVLARLGYADVMLCGIIGSYQNHIGYVQEVMGLRSGATTVAGMNVLITTKGNLFMCDTHVNLDPDAEQIAEMTLMAANTVKHFGIIPKVALLSYANFGSRDSAQSRKMAAALQLIHKRAPELEAEGEMQADAALSEDLRLQLFPNSQLKGAANLLIMPNLDAANIAFNLLKIGVNGVSVGPIIMGLEYPAHVMAKTSTVRGIVNMAAVAAVHAQQHASAVPLA